MAGNDREPIGRKGKPTRPVKQKVSRRRYEDDDDYDDYDDYEDEEPMPRKGKGKGKGRKQKNGAPLDRKRILAREPPGRKGRVCPAGRSARAVQITFLCETGFRSAAVSLGRFGSRPDRVPEHIPVFF